MPSAPSAARGIEWLGSGREAEVRAWGPGRVLRRYRRDRAVTGEADLMVWLIEHGYPVPRVHEHSAGGLVMERIHGPTVAEAIRSGACTPEASGQLIAGLQNALHALDPATAPASLGSPRPGDAVLHFDLHPRNVMLRNGATARPVVIDWSTAMLGAPGLDVAISALLMARVALRPSLAGPEVGLEAGPLRRYLTSFLAAADHPPLPHLDEASQRLAKSPFHTLEEKELLPAAGRMVRRAAPGDVGDDRASTAALER